MEYFPTKLHHFGVNVGQYSSTMKHVRNNHHSQSEEPTQYSTRLKYKTAYTSKFLHYISPLYIPVNGDDESGLPFAQGFYVVSSIG